MKPYYFDPAAVVHNDWVFRVTKTKVRLPPQDCSTQWEDPAEILEAIKRAKDELELCRQTLTIVGDAPREDSTKIGRAHV